jgi:hypothetical protein
VTFDIGRNDCLIGPLKFDQLSIFPLMKLRKEYAIIEYG